MEELKALKDVSASLGLRLENSSPRLCLEGMPHYRSPGKNPRLRLRTIRNAGKLRIPFTTGLLVGMGESMEEIETSLRDIAELHSRYGHIQEIIIQNFRPKKGTLMEAYHEPSVYEMIWAIRLAKKILPKIGLQVPPNLNPYTWSIYLLFGVDDLGGISPVTNDYINPPDAWPKVEEVESRLTPLGYRLKERLPIYPEYIARGWFSGELKTLIFKYTDRDGLVIA
jgi:7,8-didemethyl-8-hydroxy-5-deazariboflavin synthase CofG subunit